ncbi:hypothetical protein QBC44DRAFT_377257 [Cladorrhinum sp. PSN332]|nr:hypothetical protein QBC44DRAFT_377257 [Cladorrhinum sp. PSN332]
MQPPRDGIHVWSLDSQALASNLASPKSRAAIRAAPHDEERLRQWIETLKTPQLQPPPYSAVIAIPIPREPLSDVEKAAGNPPPDSARNYYIEVLPPPSPIPSFNLRSWLLITFLELVMVFCCGAAFVYGYYWIAGLFAMMYVYAMSLRAT